ncbi:MAG: hypothetical protein PHF64_00125 [Methanoregula sp.]|jgi:hypothetical protein|nr:hypothetical protein [Methanoregula sp.]
MKASYTLEDVRKQLKLRTIPQARNRVNLIKHDFVAKGWITYGRNNRMELAPDALAVLKQMEEMAGGGATQREAAMAISAPQDKGKKTSSTLERKVDALAARLDEIERTMNDGWSIALVPRSKT